MLISTDLRHTNIFRVEIKFQVFTKAEVAHHLGNVLGFLIRRRFYKMLHATHALPFSVCTVWSSVLFQCFTRVTNLMLSCAKVDWWWFTELVICSRRAQREKGWAHNRLISIKFYYFTLQKWPINPLYNIYALVFCQVQCLVYLFSLTKSAYIFSH